MKTEGAEPPKGAGSGRGRGGGSRDLAKGGKGRSHRLTTLNNARNKANNAGGLFSSSSSSSSIFSHCRIMSSLSVVINYA